MGTIKKAAERSAQSQVELWQDNHYYDEAEPYIEEQWKNLIWPIIKNLNFSHVVDLACGRGRNTTKLIPICKKISLVDIASNNIKFCKKRFKKESKVDYYLGSGVEIPVPDNSVSLVYCFDAMVHFPPEVVFEYLNEIKRVLIPGGAAFLHHSNWNKNSNINFSTNPHARNHMSRNLMMYWANSIDLKIVSSQIIDWGEGIYKATDLDCVTLLRKKICQG